MLPNSTVAVLPLERLTKLHDGLEQLEEMWGDDASEGEEDDVEDEEDVEVWAMDDDGHWVEDDVEDAEDWESTDEDDGMDLDEEGWSSSSPTVLQAQEIDAPIITPSHSDASDDTAAQSPTPPSTVRPSSPDVPKDATDVEDVDRVEGNESQAPWKRFEVLPSTPPDHAFFASPPAQTSRNFLARLRREYRVLQDSLPGNDSPPHHGLYLIDSFLLDSILVRAYEDRTDLLRCLIIGPENTPYQDAPFVIDWMLDSNFPQSPPIAHFLSWTNGNGRGMVCTHCHRHDFTDGVLNLH